ncbi:hypothetical protein PoB_006494800 [Plakobranchus ocellatus]|uniref:Uncharacterized protein n=1 Tax=Plakobranchus ocellatus TaxID=259542 RepID=A0AAV4D2Q1_9GAST|nr:hypothetical protein PoB_006494800 [Plakobranchus ocellatus]
MKSKKKSKKNQKRLEESQDNESRVHLYSRTETEDHSDKDRKHRETKLMDVGESKTKSATNDTDKTSKTKSTHINGTDAAGKKSRKKEGTNSTLEEVRGRTRCRRTEKDTRLFLEKARSFGSKRTRPDTPVSEDDPPTRRIRGLEDGKLRPKLTFQSRT